MAAISWVFVRFAVMNDFPSRAAAMLRGTVAALLLLVSFSIEARAQLSSFQYTTSNGQVTITGYSGPVPQALVIPATINGLPVTAIGDTAFENNTTMKSLTLPDSVTSIGANSFYQCVSLRTVSMGNGGTSIGFGAFTNDSAVTSMPISTHLVSIDTFGFYNMSGLKTLTLPDTLTTL